MLWTSLSIALKGNHYLKAFSRRKLLTSCSQVQSGNRLGSLIELWNFFFFFFQLQSFRSGLTAKTCFKTKDFLFLKTVVI